MKINGYYDPCTSVLTREQWANENDMNGHCDRPRMRKDCKGAKARKNNRAALECEFMDSLSEKTAWSEADRMCTAWMKWLGPYIEKEERDDDDI